MMQHIHSDSPGDFVAIYEPDVELISVCRPSENLALNQAADTLANNAVFSERWSQSVDDVDLPANKLAAVLDKNAAEALGHEIVAAADLLSCLLDCPEVGIRIGTITTPMCPRFHVDRVPCRLLLTLTGKGTEWIANDDVDFAAFADRSADKSPLKSGCSSRYIETGDWALLKGGTWREEFDGVVHRSPGSDRARVLLSIDPIFA